MTILSIMFIQIIAEGYQSNLCRGKGQVNICIWRIIYVYLLFLLNRFSLILMNFEIMLDNLINLLYYLNRNKLALVLLYTSIIFMLNRVMEHFHTMLYWISLRARNVTRYVERLATLLIYYFKFGNIHKIIIFFTSKVIMRLYPYEVHL